MPIYPMDELSNTESNPVIEDNRSWLIRVLDWLFGFQKRLYEKAKESRAARIFLFIMIIDEPLIIFLLAKMAYF